MMIRACEELELVPLSHIFVKDDFPEGTAERIVIHVKSQSRGDIFYKGFVEVNVVVPDDNDHADHETLGEIEKVLNDAFKYDTVGEFEGETYRYGLSSMGRVRPPLPSLSLPRRRLRTCIRILGVTPRTTRR